MSWNMATQSISRLECLRTLVARNRFLKSPPNELIHYVFKCPWCVLFSRNFAYLCRYRMAWSCFTSTNFCPDLAQLYHRYYHFFQLMKFPFELGCGWKEFFDIFQFWVPLRQNWQDICILRHCIFTPSFVASGGDIFTSLSVLPQLFGFPILSWANAKNIQISLKNTCLAKVQEVNHGHQINKFHSSHVN